MNELKQLQEAYYQIFLAEARASESDLAKTIAFLEKEKQVLLITTSTRPPSSKDDIPKSTQLARFIQSQVGTNKCKIIDASSLNILPCTGNVSSAEGNQCGLKGALLKDKKKILLDCTGVGFLGSMKTMSFGRLQKSYLNLQQ